MSQYEDLLRSIENSKKATKELDEQMNNLDEILEKTIEGLSGPDQEKVQRLKAMANRVLNKAKEGKDYKEALDAMKNTFNFKDK